jgi:hypothetical protein
MGVARLAATDCAFDGGPCDYRDLKIHSDDVMEFVRRERERGITG